MLIDFMTGQPRPITSLQHISSSDTLLRVLKENTLHAAIEYHVTTYIITIFVGESIIKLLSIRVPL